MGKTTLAQLVYEDVRMKDQFEHRAWICVSEFDVVRVTKEILQSLDCPTEHLHDFHAYQLKLKETLMVKKFFLVLDDVWNEDHQIWEAFQAPLKYVAPQSKILVTTRNEKVAEVMCCNFSHSLKPLEDGDCWNFFAEHAFGDQHHVADRDLEPIGRKIVIKCGGLPLAIKTLGSLLQRKLSSQYWDMILESDIWKLSENDSNIIPSLRLSYHYLPSHLKRCFAYCSIFPKDYDIDKDVLIRLWMADGLIHPNHKKDMSLEEVGNEIFNDLESRSFFEPSRKGDAYFTMHDLVNDLAKSVTEEFFVQLEGDQAQNISTKTRYFSYVSTNFQYITIPEEVLKCYRLRSFLLLDTYVHDFGINVDIMSKLSHLKYIRELCLEGYKGMKNLTNGVGNMKQLRYLNLSGTSVEKLPNSLCLLINLQTLNLSRRFSLFELPSNFYKLINLRHLYLEGCNIMKMPKYMGKLNQLRTMDEFVVAKKGGSNIKELGALIHLTGSLRISNMKYIEDAADLREANLKEKKLDELSLVNWQSDCNREEGQNQGHLLEAVEPNYNVKVLYVDGYEGNKFPKWLASSEFLPNLGSLRLACCTNIESLPPLGQLPSLHVLTIERMGGIKVIGEEFYGNGSLIAPFPCLSYLEFFRMLNWEEWDICYEGESFPCLKELRLIDCGRLAKSMPRHLPCLKALAIKGCPKLIASGRDWGLHELLSLKELEICSVEVMECFPEEGLLPPNLKSLSFLRCEKLKSINHRGLMHLHSLTSLSFKECPNMSFEGMPEDGLPPSLSHLTISHGCELLEERCEKEKGPDWPIIAYIPHIHMIQRLS